MENRNALFCENSPIGYALLKVIYDKEESPIDFEVSEVNEAFEKMTGFQRSTVIGRTGSAITLQPKLPSLTCLI